jgi:hypothetical protein
MEEKTKRDVLGPYRLCSWRAALTPSDVRRIRSMHAAGKTQGEIRRKFSHVSQSTISQLLRGVTYKRVA